MTNQPISKLSCLLTGVGVGISMAVLFAPRSGVATRNLIQRSGERGIDLLKAKTREGQKNIRRRRVELRGQAGELLRRGKRSFNKQKDQLASVIEAGKEAYQAAARRVASAS
jgi:gas vesicle protein